eukprot:jgi/Mesen1/10208/ME000077S09544
MQEGRRGARAMAMAMAGPAAVDAELVSRTLQVEHKLFYLDLKENPRGRYLKISEKTSGSRSTIIVPHAGIVFYFDVGENQRGRFLKVSEASVARSRSTIIIPAGASGDQGWAALSGVLAEIHEAMQALPPLPLQSPPTSTSTSTSTSTAPSAVSPLPLQPGSGGGQASYAAPPAGGGTGAAAGSVEGPQQGGGLSGSVARQLRAEQKRFFFDYGANARGHFLKISEVTGAERSSIILPASALEQFHATIGYFVDIQRAQGGPPAGSSANVRTIAPPRRRQEEP